MVIPIGFVPVINVLLIAGLIVAVVVGYIKGFIWELLKVLGLIAAAFLCWIVSPGLSQLISIYPKSWAPFAGTSVGDIIYEKINYFVWFIILMIICLIIITILKPIFKVITEIPVIKQVNQGLGVLLGFIKYFIIVFLLTYVMNSALIKNGKEIVSASFLRYVEIASKSISGLAGNVLDENVAIQKLVSDPLNLTEEDINNIISWLNKSKLTPEQIREFLENYGLDVNQVNDLLGNQQ